MSDPFHGISVELEQYLLEHPEVLQNHEETVDYDGMPVPYHLHVEMMNIEGGFKIRMAEIIAKLSEE